MELELDRRDRSAANPAGVPSVDPAGNPSVDPRPFRVLVTCGVFEPGFRGGGPIRSVARIIDSASAQIELVLVTRDRDLGATSAYPGLSGRWVPRGRARVFYLNAGRPRQWLRLWRELRTERFDLLYVNSVWSAYSIVPVALARLRLLRAGRILVAPRGEFSPGALSLKAGKKRVFLWWWARLLRRMGVIWHAATSREAGEIRAVCPWARVEVNENQVSLPDEPIPAGTVADGPARLVFVGRICAKKNLTLALAALAKVRRPVAFDVYGPVEDAAYWAACQALIGQLPASVEFTYRGELPPDRVRPAFAGYDAFVFPTRGENFGHVIAESLSASCPVVCSDQTPWTPVLEAGGGVVVPGFSVYGLAGELDRIAAMSPADRLRARQRAGTAYRTWRRAVHGPNILDQTRLALCPPVAQPVVGYEQERQ